jgi:hypothetical protein
MNENFIEIPLKLIALNEKSAINEFKGLTNITIDNHTYSINSTDNNPECKYECYLNCQVHFPDPTEQKFCLINICKCVLIENLNLSPINPGISMLALNTVTEKNGIHCIEQQKLVTPGWKENVIEKEKEDRYRFQILMIILLIFLIPSLIYFSYEMYKYYDIAYQHFYHIQSVNNDQYSLIETH